MKPRTGNRALAGLNRGLRRAEGRHLEDAVSFGINPAKLSSYRLGRLLSRYIGTLAGIFFMSAIALGPARLAEASVPDMDAGLVTPGLTSALAEDARAPRENPAGLAFLEGSELQALHLRADGAQATGVHFAGGLGMLGAGIGQEWLQGPELTRQRRTGLSLALGGRTASLGATVRWSSLAGDDETRRSYDIGATTRWYPWLSLSARARDLGLSESTSYSAGVGVRLFGDDVTMGVDRVWRPDERLQDLEGLLSWGVILRVARGLSLTSQVLHPLTDPGDDLRLQVALTLDLSIIGVTGGYAPTGSSDDLYGALRVSSARHRPLTARKEQVFVDLEEALSPAERLIIPAARRDPLVDLIRLLDQARRDPEVDAVVIRASGREMLSFSEAEDLRQSIDDLREEDKRVYFYLDGADDWTLYLASNADLIVASPTTFFNANGLTLTATFLAEGLEKIGVNPQFVRAGEFKTSPDTFQRSEMSEPHREALDTILQDTWTRYVVDTAEGLGIAKQDLVDALDQGIYGAEAARRAGLVDILAYPDEIPSILARQGHRASMVKHYHGRRFADTRWGRPPTIAVVPVTGTIVHGETPTGIFATGEVSGSKTVVRAIERAVDDSSVRAIVLRVDSPGGEAHASDLIWRAVREANEVKPVVASMGSVAASGGYYVASGAGEIVAAPSTITGSIGVFAGSVDLSGLLDMIGVNRVTLKRGELADLFTIDRPWTEAEHDALRSYVDESYESFIERVAESRDLAIEEVEEVARGRIWTGAQARAHGLVDETGTFRDAVERAKELAGIRPEEVVDISLFTALNGPLAAFTGRGRPLADRLFEDTASMEGIEELVSALGPLLWVRSDVPLALLPYQIDLR